MSSSQTLAGEKPSRPPMPWRLRLSLLIAGAFTDATCRKDHTLNRRLVSFFDRRVSPNPTPAGSISTTDLTIDPATHLWARLFTPVASDPTGQPQPPVPLVVFFHGGGFAYLSAASFAYDAVCRRLSRKLNAVVLSVNYRLAPEHKFPAPYDDGVTVLRFLDNGGLDNFAPKPDLSSTFLAGDSAGGNIAHHVACRYVTDKWSRLRVAGVVSIQPFFGGEERTESELRLRNAPLVNISRTDWMWKAFLPEGADRNHEAPNVWKEEAAAAVESERFPPVLVVVGGFDPLQDWQRRYYEMLRAKGKNVRLLEYPDAIHAFYVFPEFADSGKFIAETQRFVEEFRSEEGVKKD